MTYERIKSTHLKTVRSVLSELRSERVCVCRAAHSIGHIALRVGESVLEVVHNVP